MSGQQYQLDPRCSGLSDTKILKLNKTSAETPGNARRPIFAQWYPDLNRYLLLRFGFQTPLLESRMLNRESLSAGAMRRQPIELRVSEPNMHAQARRQFIEYAWPDARSVIAGAPGMAPVNQLAPAVGAAPPMTAVSAHQADPKWLRRRSPPRSTAPISPAGPTRRGWQRKT
jgi:hypothetical protein